MSITQSKLWLWLGLIGLSFIASIAAAQANPALDKTTSITGCLQKGVESGAFTIASADGTVWELTGKIDASHVGHTIAVKGHVLHRSQVEEAKYSQDEKKESNGKPYADFEVTGLKMVSDSCK
ncbi:MAG TPA: hypothetical protein VF753_07545 [Terriglobales bacterium]